MFASVLRSLSCWLLQTALVFAPWAYASTRAECVDWLEFILILALLPWLLECFLSRKIASLPAILYFALIGLLCLGWWMAWNAHSFFDNKYFQLIPATPFFPDLPGSTDGFSSMDSMRFLSCVLPALLMAADLSTTHRLRMRLLATMVVNGAVLAAVAYGILISNIQIFDWKYGTSPFMFGPFRYHGNAGAYLNLMWPLAFGLLFFSILRTQVLFPRIALGICAGGLFLSVWINVSKGGQLVAAGMILMAGLAGAMSIKRILAVINWKKALLFIVPCVLAGVLFFASFVWERSEKRWASFADRAMEQNRLQVAKVCLDIVPDAGFLGYGPSAFSSIFPSYQISSGFENAFFWQNAHQDYLQTLIEWGYLGTFLWVLVIGGGLVRLIHSIRWQNRHNASSRLVIPLAIALSLVGIYSHAMLDFPLQVPSLQLYAAVLLGMAWSCPSWIEMKTKKRRLQADGEKTV